MANENDAVATQGATTTETEQAVQVPQNIRNLHGKALAALERNNPDIAIDIFLRCVEQCPGFTAARRNLRLTQIARYKAANKHNSLAHRLPSIPGMIKSMKIQGLMKAGKYDEALVESEKLMLLNPLNVSYIRLLAKAAIGAGYTEDGLMSVEIVREHLPAGSLPIIELLGRLYFEVKNYRKAREFLERVHRARPNDAEIATMLKNSEALATLDAGWEQSSEEGDFRVALANEEQAVKLEQESKMVKSADDAESLIEEALKKIEAEPRNINYYLSLVSLYAQQKRFDDALQTVEKARELIGADAELDRRYSNIMVAKFDAEIAALRGAGDANGAVEKETERNQYIFDDIADRVQRYPNDQHLRYELGLQYFKYDHIDEAIQQFQIAQRNPKDRVSALYHLALCFRKKGLLDMAVSQLEQALEFIPGMSNEKLEILYLLGEVTLEEGNLDEAAKHFKEVYKVDVTYRDIGKYIEKIYAAQKKEKSE
ncbi:MAG: tetratricopeptide repeat protein [Kiritimatiellia bacterium]|jgi:tetratricopeptide (TPR) repeat protein|uniref:tetratricopeptide repeat protein n=1 Tax=Atribacter sp. TaxID=2847780 RepID=UPI003D97571C